MARSRVNFRFIQPEWDRLRYSRNGIVGRDIDRRGEYVERMAKIQVGVDSNALRTSIRRSVHTSPGMGPSVLIQAGGASIDYAIMHHEGTRPHRIQPRAPRRVLKFNRGGKTFYATQVMHPGTQANRYLTDHLPQAVSI